MAKVNFTKLEGTGNDFILIDTRTEDLEGSDPAKLATVLCDRHFGIGADGLLLVLPSNKAEVKMRIINSDGSEAEMCGNGIRCLAKYVYEKSEQKKELLSVETLAGILLPSVIEYRGRSAIVEVDMGEPILKRSRIPMKGKEAEKVVNEDLKINGQTFKVTCVSMGNPHCVIFINDISRISVSEIGPRIENNESFPKKTNVEFAQVMSKDSAVIKVWERGAGETLACGTGACAVLVAGVLNDKLSKKTKIELPGGKLECEWIENNHVIMRGEATTVFEGSITI